jgi:CRP-like cAMP-binding protein
MDMKKILLIEDNEDIRNNTAEILELSNYKVIVAENGKVGVKQAIAHKPDLILCDIMMPVLDGYGVMHAIHKNDVLKNIPFIFVTAKSERSDFRKGMELGTELLNAVDSRLKKIDLFRQQFSAGLEGLSQLMQTTLGEKSLQAFTTGRNINKYKRKQVIYTEGNHPNRLYYVVKGKVKTFKTNEDGKELVMELFSTGDFLGYIALLEGTVYRDTAAAMEETDLAVIPKEDFDELINKNPEISKKFIQLLARNISEKEDHLLGLAYNSLRKKVADALLVLQQKYQENKEERFTIDISRESLATIAGTATESLIRTLSDFRNEKMVEINNGSIIIINQQKLEDLVN